MVLTEYAYPISVILWSMCRQPYVVRSQVTNWSRLNMQRILARAGSIITRWFGRRQQGHQDLDHLGLRALAAPDLGAVWVVANRGEVVGGEKEELVQPARAVHADAADLGGSGREEEPAEPAQIVDPGKVRPVRRGAARTGCRTGLLPMHGATIRARWTRGDVIAGRYFLKLSDRRIRESLAALNDNDDDLTTRTADAVLKQ